MAFIEIETLQNWWNLINLGRHEVEFLKKILGPNIYGHGLPDDENSSQTIDIRINDFNLHERQIVQSILHKQHEYKEEHGEKESFYWTYLIKVPDKDIVRMNVGSASGIIWIWDELQKRGSEFD